MGYEDIASKLFDKSLAFLEGAIATSKANDLSMFNTSEYSNVTAHLLHHSIELFLKFSIVAYTKQFPVKGKHDLVELHNEYKQIYSDTLFTLDIPFNNAPQYVGMTQQQIDTYESNFSMDIGLQLRYPVGKQGEPYSPITKFDTDYLVSFRANLLKLRCQILPCEEIEQAHKEC
jgi:hypothetical protein